MSTCISNCPEQIEQVEHVRLHFNIIKNIIKNWIPCVFCAFRFDHLIMIMNFKLPTKATQKKVEENLDREIN
ncbi:hypothetical protein BpHYR1_054560 [Brachionus plicatilis]|uniref:Uncharacterized protein n=1 Tax=Brachionus plicatilis TaxID=10195 RepID=A0A3M7SF57_BRAPC|nr:hypothetical protein BpHYR1_054560 [Brachionus plicatilis]